MEIVFVCLGFSVFVFIGFCLFGYDFCFFILPNRLVFVVWFLGVVFLSLASLCVGNYVQILRLFSASFLVLFFYGFLAYFGEENLGWGDVKLAAAFAVYLGWLGWDFVFYANVFAWLCGFFWALCLLVFGKNSGKSFLPFGCCLVLGVYFSLLFV